MGVSKREWQEQENLKQEARDQLEMLIDSYDIDRIIIELRNLEEKLLHE